MNNAVMVSNEATYKNEIKRLYNIIGELEQELQRARQESSKSQYLVEQIKEILNQ